MPPFFKLGEPFNSPFVGNPHLMAMEEAGIEAPQVEAAMKAAKNVLSDAGGANMGGTGTPQDETDQIVCATARSALNHPDDLGPARLVRLALFVDEYRKFRNTVAMKEVLDQIVEQRKAEYKSRARQWAGETYDAIKASEAKRTSEEVPWKKLLMFTGLGALVIAIFKLLFGGRPSSHQRDEIEISPDMVLSPPSLPPPPPAPPRLPPAEPHHHHEEGVLEESESG